MTHVNQVFSDAEVSNRVAMAKGKYVVPRTAGKAIVAEIAVEIVIVRAA